MGGDRPQAAVNDLLERDEAAVIEAVHLIDAAIEALNKPDYRAYKSRFSVATKQALYGAHNDLVDVRNDLMQVVTQSREHRHDVLRSAG